MRFTLVIKILVIFSISCTNDGFEIPKSKMTFTDLENKTVKLEEKYSFDGDGLGYSFIDVEASKSGDIFAFDQKSGSIVKLGEGSVIKKTGGIGKGPNEYDVEAKPSLLVCNEEYLIAFELRAARYQVYDLELNYIKTILLDAIPEEIICYSEDEIAAFYYLKDGIEIMRLDGNVTKKLKYQESWPGNNLTFKEAIYSNGNFFISYIFDPKLAIYSEGFGVSELVTLPVINPDSVRFATKNISKSGSDIHLYFYNDHAKIPKESRKKGYVFSDEGSYKYTYQVPPKINYYKFFSENKLIAVEDTLKKISVYKFIINE